ncbi:MAG: hypothetical protein ROO76_05775 [Terriglobia bacterium]|jgi:hypothetical protein|nr:hypothetical protein [Terriglobia bacterium]
MSIQRNGFIEAGLLETARFEAGPPVGALFFEQLKGIRAAVMGDDSPVFHG